MDNLWENYMPALLGTPLFSGFGKAQLSRLLPHLAPVLRPCQKGESILQAGSPTGEIGIVLTGGIEALKFTRAGGQFTVSRMGPGGVFGDVLSGSNHTSPVTVAATRQSLVLLVSTARLFAPPPNAGAEPLFRKLLANLVAVISDKYFALNARLDLVLIHGLRNRLAAFLLDFAEGAGSTSFTIPYTRSQLASYLGCDRSALSREVSRLAADGLIQANRAHFTLCDTAALAALF